MQIEKRIELIKSPPTEEIITEQDLRSLLTSKKHPVAYDGFEASGRLHVASGLLRAIKIQHFLDAGVSFIIRIADWHAWLNNKLGGDLDAIQACGKYFVEGWKACGVDTKKVKIWWASEDAADSDYWKLVLKVSKLTTVKRMTRCATIMGRKEAEMQHVSQLIYPAMQAADPIYKGVDICQLGMDQRRVTILSRELAPKLGFKPPVCIHHHLLMGLSGPAKMGADKIEQEIEQKMSKSKEASAIFIHDTDEQIKNKINSAYCKEKSAADNPILEMWKHILFHKIKRAEFSRPPKFGGDISFDSYPALESAYKSGSLHPADLKAGTAEALTKIIAPVRRHFTSGKAKDLYEQVRKLEITR